jgi:putative peptidoglycan lipid II flippase
LVNSFYSLQDTLTPVKTAGASLVVNTILSVILMWPLKLGGLALATYIAGIFNFFLLFSILQKRIGGIKWIRILDSFLRVLIASFLIYLSKKQGFFKELHEKLRFKYVAN